MSSRLVPTICRGLINVAGTTPKSKALVERLLDEDRAKYHCFTNEIGFHNHLSHHLLTAYDLGASDRLLQAVYQKEVKEQRPIELSRLRDASAVKPKHLEITMRNWKSFLGQHEYYAAYLSFFCGQVADHGSVTTLDQFIFAPFANSDGADMLQRFVGGHFHSLIQVGYGAEFGSDAMIAQGLAQTAVSLSVAPELFRIPFDTSWGGNSESLLSILRLVYESQILKPAMLDPNKLLRVETRDALNHDLLNNTVVDEIRRLASYWFRDTTVSEEGVDTKVEELFWMSTLLVASTSKPDRPPQLEFFLMHVLTSSLFIPSILRLIPNTRQKLDLLQMLLPIILYYLVIRGRPKIDPELIMACTDTPSPPGHSPAPSGDAIEPHASNPWPSIIQSVVHAPDAHTTKVVRALCYAAQRYGTTPRGSVPGTFASIKKRDGEQVQGVETHHGISGVDGTLFVRAAGWVMNNLGWVTHGEPAGHWDNSTPPPWWDDMRRKSPL